MQLKLNWKKNENSRFCWLLLILVWLIPLFLFAQIEEECGTQLPIIEGEAKLSCAYQSDCYGAISCRSCNIETNSCGKIKVPIVFTIIKDNFGSGGADVDALEANLDLINSIYSSAEIEFFQASSIRSGGSFNSSALYHYDDNGNCGGIDDGLSLNDLDVPNVINIYLVGTFTRCGGTFSAAGFYPGGPARIVEQKDRVESSPSVMAHEIGHIFGLMHTHEGYNSSNPDLGSGGTCTSRGDKICDTPADPKLNLNDNGVLCYAAGQDYCDCNKAPALATSSCSGIDPCVYNGPSGYNPDMDNLMSSNPWTLCPRESITPCQAAKVNNILTECRNTLCVTPPNPTVLPVSSVNFGQSLPILTAQTNNSTVHTGNCVHWFSASSGGILLASNTSTFQPEYGSGIGFVNEPGTFDVWIQDISPINAGCKSNRVKVSLVVEEETPSVATGTEVRLRAFLEGPYNPATNEMETSLRDADQLPPQQPFDGAPWFYNGDEGLSNSSLLPFDMVDWVLVEVRALGNNNTIVEQKAAFLLSDGTVRDAYSSTGVIFQNLDDGANYYLAVKARNHLAVLGSFSIAVPNTAVYNFSHPAYVLEGGQNLQSLGNGKYGLFSGDFDADGAITVNDYNFYEDEASEIGGYFSADSNLDNAVTVEDFNFYRSHASSIGVPQIRY